MTPPTTTPDGLVRVLYIPGTVVHYAPEERTTNTLCGKRFAVPVTERNGPVPRKTCATCIAAADKRGY